MCNQGDVVGFANEEMLRHEETWDEHPSGFILHTVNGRTDLGAHASKALPAGWDLV